jgi:hypothetical protein
MAAPLGGAGKVAEAAENPKLEFRSDIQLGISASGWSLDVSDSRQEQRQTLRIQGRVLPVRLDSQPVFISENLQIEEICNIEFSMRLNDSHKEDGGALGQLSVSVYQESEWFLADTFLVIDVAIAKPIWDELKESLLAGRRMPDQISIFLKNAEMHMVHTDRGAKRILGDQQLIQKIAWSVQSLATEIPHGSLWRRERAALLAFMDERLASTDCRGHAWMLPYWQYRQITAELIASAWLGAAAKGEPPRYAASAAWRLANEVFEALATAAQQTRLQRTTRARGSNTRPCPTDEITWNKRDPAEDFRAGLDHIYWSSIEKEEMNLIARDYLCLGLESAHLEWVIVDALIYAEVRNFAESVKRFAPSFFSAVSRAGDVAETGGNMARVAIRQMWRNLLFTGARAAIFLAAPGYFAFTAYGRGDVTTAALSATAGVAAWLLWPRIAKALGLAAVQPNTEYERRVSLLSEMAIAYTEVKLDRPPSVVLAALGRAASKGAAWEGSAVSLLIHADARRPVMWGSFASSWEENPVLAISERLRAAHANLSKSGETLPTPDLDARDSRYTVGT